jgi:hypothetical protein
MPVPDCEPPFDDEADRQPRTAPRLSPRLVVGPPTDIADPDACQGIHAAEPAAVTTAGAAPTDGPLTSSVSAAAPESDWSDPADERAPALSQRERPHRPDRVLRSERSPALRAAAPTDVLLLDPVRTARPTTIASPGVPSWSSEADIGVRKTASHHLPPADRAASVLARALVEVLSGQRPLAQLRVHCAPEIYAGLGERPPAPPMALPHLLTVRVCEPADGVAEVGVAFRRADRVKALAFRIEGVDGRWRITALQLG